MRARLLLCLAIAALLAAMGGGSAGASSDDASAAASKHRLAKFGSCKSLVRYGKRHMRTVSDGPQPGGPPIFQAPAARGPLEDTQSGPTAPASPAPVEDGGAPSGDDFSLTNVQETGVDEPDIVKTNGKTLFVVAGQFVHAIDVRAAAPRVIGSLRVDDGFPGELLLYRDRLLVLGSAYVAMPVDSGTTASSPIGPGAASTKLTEIDISDPTAMAVLRTQTIEGNYVGARRHGASARVVITSTPRAYYEPNVRNRRSGWVPTARFRSRTGKKRTRPAVSCRSVRRPRRFSGTDVLSVLTIDMGKGLPAVDSDAVMSSAQTVYSSAGSIYVATQRWAEQVARPEDPPSRPHTAIHRFGASERGETAYRASGEVRGYVLNQFSLSEHRGRLRVATTEQPAWWGGSAPSSESFVTVLGERDGALRTFGSVDGLGRGERIYAVRFVDDVGYVVTFRQIDPLYTLDLSDPEHPRVMGELKIRGYSAYLHPLDGNLLLGVGQDATGDGRTTGTQVSLFDVSDLREPKRLQQHALGSSSSSEVEYDHHAFLWWAPTSLAVLPLSSFGDGGLSFTGAVGLRVERGGISEAGRISHPGEQPGPPVRRSLVVGDQLLTVSSAGVKASSLSGLGDVGWAAFPAEG